MTTVTPEGLVIKRLSDVLAAKRALAVSLLQDMVAPGDVVDTSDSSAIGRLVSLASPGEADLWEAIQEVYSAFDENTALGIPLDNMVGLAGIVRYLNTYTTCQALFSGSNGALIPLNSVVSSSTTSNRFTVVAPVALSPTVCSGCTVIVSTVTDSTLYAINYTQLTTAYSINYTSGVGATQAQILSGLKVVIDVSHPMLVASIVNNSLVINLVDVFQPLSFTTTTNLGITKVIKQGDLIAEQYGPLTQNVNTIDTIVIPVIGWDNVTNPQSAVAGRFLETDEELRTRFRESKFLRASNIIESLYSALKTLDGVQQVIIYENDTDMVDSHGIPAHSFMPIVLGGLTSVVGKTIWNNKPLGIRSYGSTVISVSDSQGFVHDIGIERPSPIPIYITIDLTTDSNFPQNGIDTIKADLIAYTPTQFGIGDEVLYSRLYTPINAVPGHSVDSLYIGTSPSPTGTANIPIAFNQLHTLDPANIIITT